MDYERRKAFRAWSFLSEEEKNDLRWLSNIAGLPVGDQKPAELLSSWEETQADYDDLWWQKHHIKRFIPGWFRACCRRDSVKYVVKLSKAKHLGFRPNYRDNSAKRKTLRTHRDGSRRHYRLRPREM